MGYEIYKMTIHILLIIMIIEQVIIAVGKRKRNVYHLLLSTIVIINVGAFAVLMNAKTLEVALEANRITYIGGCMLPLVILKIGAGLCNLKIKTKWYVLLSVFGFMALAFAWSSGYSDLYYKEVRIEVVDGLTVLHKTYGPLHIFYNFYLGFYMLFALVIVISGIRNRRNYFNKMVLFYALIWGLVDSTYFLERILHNNARIMPISMSVGMTLFVFWFRRVALYDMNTSLINIEEREKENGYIVFDTKLRLLGINNKAVEFFPELKLTEIDSPVDKIRETEFYKEVCKPMIVAGDLKRLEGIRCKDKTIRVELRRLNAMGHLLQRGWLMEIYDTSEETRYREMLRDYRIRLEADVRDKTKDLDRIRQTIVMGMASMIESRDFSTGGHIKRTSDVVAIFAEELLNCGYPLGRRFLHLVVIAAPMHDLGKIAVDDDVLRKKGKYTSEEYEEMKQHAAKGAVIVRRVLSGMDDEELVNVVANVAHYHHEKWNGQGYPTGLKGEEIPVEARIMALADVFDALVSKRYYKDAYSYDDAFKIIEESIGSHFDPELGRIFLSVRPKLEELYDRYALENGDELRREAGQ